MSRELPLPPNGRIPRHAKKVFAGEIFDVYQWQQQMYDGTYATFEGLRRDDAVLVIPMASDGQIIATEQEQPGRPPFLTFAGGRMDSGETPEQAAKRELLEETGYAAKKLDLWFSVQPYGKLDWTIYTYIGRDCRKVQEQKQDRGEKITLQLLSFNQFIQLASRDDLRDKEVTLRVLQARLDNTSLRDLKKLFQQA